MQFIEQTLQRKLISGSDARYARFSHGYVFYKLSLSLRLSHGYAYVDFLHL